MTPTVETKDCPVCLCAGEITLMSFKKGGFPKVEVCPRCGGNGFIRVPSNPHMRTS